MKHFSSSTRCVFFAPLQFQCFSRISSKMLMIFSAKFAKLGIWNSHQIRRFSSSLNWFWCNLFGISTCWYFSNGCFSFFEEAIEKTKRKVNCMKSRASEKSAVAISYEAVILDSFLFYFGKFWYFGSILCFEKKLYFSHTSYFYGAWIP